MSHRFGRRGAVIILNPRAVAEDLEKENAVTNGGRGSSVVKTMIDLLRRNRPGSAEEAQAVWDTDRDKVRQYPKLYALAVRLGFGG